MKLTGKTKIIGIFGDPIEHSLSPIMHNAAFSSLNIDYSYIPFNVHGKDLGNAVQAVRSLNLIGCNITIPHKEEVLKYLDELSPEAELIGAVNTIVNVDNKLIGYNTDGAGFYRSMVEVMGYQPKDKKVLIIGTGGASRAVCFQLALEGVGESILTNRNLQKAENLAEEIVKKTTAKVKVTSFDDSLNNVISEADIIIDTTPIGMYPRIDEEPIINPDYISSSAVVCDLVYNPYKTTLLQRAEAKGCKVVPGIGMLIYQGAIGFEKWTKEKAPIEVMEKALKEYLFG
jgi:shikimate dehydrogenase